MEQYYWCPNCGHIFDDPGFVSLWNRDEIGWFREVWSCCPKCQHTDFEEALQCEGCGRWFNPYSDEVNEDGLCGDCTYKSLMAPFEKKVKAC